MILRRIYLALRGLPKTLLFNFKYLRFREAVRLPVWVSHHVWLKSVGGEVVLDVSPSLLRSGLVRIGFNDVGIFDRRYSRAIWEVSGKVIFRGEALIGHGSKISVSGVLELGAHFTMTAESTIVSRKRIRFGENCLVSWDVLVMDTDFHKIYDGERNRINEDDEITIGDRVWIGCRALVLKGVEIEHGCVIAANTTISRSVRGEQKLIAGNPPSVKRDDVQWES
jgi:acetyltransferase-like isoleucine patch superfamily enzyme